MLSERELSAAIGSTAYDGSGDKIGTVEHFFVDDRTGVPTWVAVTTGLFGTRSSVAPAVDATFADGDLRLPVSAEAVKSAPRVDGNHLDPAEEADLRRHYGVGSAGGSAAPPPPAEATQEMPAVTPPAPPAADLERPTGTPAESPVGDGSMVRSEERLQVGTERVAAKRVRLVKYVVTEDVQVTVPIRREEIRIEEIPVDAADELPGGLAAEEESLVPSGRGTGHTAGEVLPEEIVLHAERPVVTVEVVPTERVRLRTELVQGQETVTGQVQREQIAVDRNPSGHSAPAPGDTTHR